MTITREGTKTGANAEYLGRFGHHPDPACDFCIEVERLESRLFNAEGRISKPGTAPETVAAVLESIERAMTFSVGGDPIAVKAKVTLRALEARAKAGAEAVHEYVATYEFRGDQDYTPTDGERTLIEDAIRGFLGLAAAPTPPPAEGIIGELRALCDPMAEALSDGARLDRFIYASASAADEIERLQQCAILDGLERKGALRTAREALAEAGKAAEYLDRAEAAEAELASIKAGPIVYGIVPPARLRIVPAQGDEVATLLGTLFEDYQTHHNDFRRACEIARDNSQPAGVDHDDPSYWQHQIDTLAKLAKARAALTNPTTEER